jgi:hypothetical protein
MGAMPAATDSYYLVDSIQAVDEDCSTAKYKIPVPAQWPPLQKKRKGNTLLVLRKQSEKRRFCYKLGEKPAMLI